MRISVVAAGVALLLALAGCSSDPAPKFASPSSAPSDSASKAADGPPPMPALAREHTPAGAKAFVRHYWDVVNHAQETLDDSQLRSLSDDQCVGCRGGLKFIARVQRGDGEVNGGENTISDLRATQIKVRGETWIYVAYRWSGSKGVIRYPRKRDVTVLTDTGRDRAYLRPTPSGWSLNMLEVVK